MMLVSDLAIRCKSWGSSAGTYFMIGAIREYCFRDGLSSSHLALHLLGLVRASECI
jgi:hypothetical protein